MYFRVITLGNARNDAIKTDLVQVGSLEFEHLMDAVTVDLVCSIANLLRGSLGASETRLDDLLGVLLEQLKGLQMSTGGDFDQLSKAVTDLSLRQSTEKGEVEKGVNWGMVGTKTILVIAVVDANLDGDGGINKTNNRSRNADKVGVPAVCGTSETTGRRTWLVSDSERSISLLGVARVRVP